MTMLLALALMASAPKGEVSYTIEDVDSSSMAYVLAYTQCFDAAWSANKDKPKDVREQALKQCTGLRAEFIEKFGESKSAGRLRSKRNLEKSLSGIERAYFDASNKLDN